MVRHVSTGKELSSSRPALDAHIMWLLGPGTRAVYIMIVSLWPPSYQPRDIEVKDAPNVRVELRRATLRRSHSYILAGWIALLGIAVIWLSGLFRRQLISCFPSHSIARKATQVVLRRPAHFATSRVGLPFFTTSTNVAVACCGLPNRGRSTSIADIALDPTRSDVHGAGISRIKVGGLRWLVGKWQISLTFGDDLVFALASVAARHLVVLSMWDISENSCTFLPQGDLFAIERSSRNWLY